MINFIGSFKKYYRDQSRITAYQSSLALSEPAYKTFCGTLKCLYNNFILKYAKKNHNKRKWWTRGFKIC